MDVEQYRIQRQHRDKKRKQLIRRFESIKIKIGPIPSAEITQTKQLIIQKKDDPEYERLVSENAKYKQQIHQFNKRSSQEILKLKEKITLLKDSYNEQISELLTISESEKSNQKTKLEDLFKQIKEQISKNKELKLLNNQILSQLQKGNEQSIIKIEVLFQERLTDFTQKLQQSNKILSELETQMNDEKVIQKALSNQELITAMVEEGKQEIKELLTNQEADGIIKEKTEIIQALVQNSQRKKEQISKIQELSQNYKDVFSKLNKEKMVLVQANKKMSQQLLKIKEMFTKIIQSADNQESVEDEESSNEDREVDDGCVAQ